MDGSILSMIKMSAVGTLVYSAINMIGDAVLGSAAALAKYQSDMEQNRIAMETFLGSAAGAKVFMQDLQKMAADTPFELPQLTDASKKMLAFGFAAKDVIPTLTAVGDAVAGLGGSQEMINRVTIAMGQMKAKGRVQGDELLQLAEAGIPAYQILQQKLGLTSQQVANIGNESINADKAIKALVEGMEERFPGMMAKQSNTARGMLSTIKDNLLAIGAALTENLYNKLEGVIGKVRDFTNAMNDLATKGDISENMKKLIPADILTSLEKIKSEYDRLMTNLEKLFGNLGDAATPVLQNIGKLFLAALPHVLALANKLAEMGNSIVPAVKVAFDLLAKVIQYVTDNSRTAVLALGAFIIITKITVWTTALYSAFVKVRAAIAGIAIMQTFTSMTTGLVAAVKGVNSLRSAVLLLGTALKTVSRGNIFTVLFALGLAVVGDKIFEMIDKLKGVEGTTDVDAARAQKEAEEAERQAKAAADEAAGRAAIESHTGTPTQDSTDYNKQYEQANKAAEAQISALNAEIDAVKRRIENEIDQMKRKSSIEGGGLSMEDAQKLAELQRDLAAAEYERYTKEQAILQSVLNPGDADSKHSDEVKKKVTDAGNKAAAAKEQLDRANVALYDMAKAAGNLASVVNSAGVNMDEVISKVTASGRQWLNRDDGVSRYGDNNLDPDKVVCSQLVVKSWEGAGIDNIVKSQGKEWYNNHEASWVPALREAAERLGAYHKVGSGYVPQPGDAIIVGADEHHATLINEKGGVINASGREKGVIESNTPWYQQYPDAVGFISLQDMVGKGGAPQTAEQFAKQYAKNANIFTQSSEEWVNAVKNLLSKTAEVNNALQENSGDITTKGYADVDAKYAAHLTTFEKAGAQYKPMLEKTQKLINIEKARVDLQQTIKDWDKAKASFEAQIQAINQKNEGLSKNIFDTNETEKAYNQTLQELANKAMAAAQKSGNPEDLAKATQMMQDVKQQAFDFANTQFEKVKAELQAKIDEINSRPGLADFEKESMIRDTKTAYSPQIKQTADAAIDAANKLGNPQQANQIRQYKRELSEVPSYYQQIGDAARNALANGLEQFFESGIFQCKSLGDAFKGLAISVIQSIQKINAQRLTTMLMKSWYPDYKPDGAATGGFISAIHGIQRFSNGGQIIGDGTGTSDSILAKVSNGEFIMKAAAVRRMGLRFMHAINQGVIPPQMLPRFATGGYVGSQSSQDLKPIQNLISAGGNANAAVKIINVDDPNAMGKYLHTKEGERVMINHVKKNVGTYRQILNIKG
jgi:tape measure domain-containing protein